MLEFKEIIEVLDEAQIKEVREALTSKILRAIDSLPVESIQEELLDSLKASLDDYDFSDILYDISSNFSKAINKALDKIANDR